MEMYYVYQHVRKDKGEIFYIGIGTKTPKRGMTFKSLYNRAHKRSVTNRNEIWQKIVAKTEYDIEIVFETDNYEKAKETEIELILKYGRKNEGGTLANITRGGDGTLGFAKQKGKESTFSKTVYQYGLDGTFIKEWGCAYEIKESLGIAPNQICDCCNNPDDNKYKTAKGFQWKYYKLDNIGKVSRYCGKKVYQFDLNGKLLKEWISADYAANSLGIKKSGISACTGGKLKTYKKTIWKTKI